MTHRVAMLAPISWRVPPRHYGPWEQFVSLLTEGLVARGVDVTLFATGDSVTTARLVGSAPTGYSEDPGLDVKVWEACTSRRCSSARRVRPDPQQLRLPAAQLQRARRDAGRDDDPRVLVATDPARVREVQRPRHYVSISDADRTRALDYAATIHHGIDMTAFEVGSGEGGYLLFFGRIHPDKGTVEAIEVARAAGLPLVIAGIVQDRDYFEQRVAPQLDGDRVRYLGPVGPAERSELLGGAAALLHLVTSTSRSASASSRRWPAARP